MTRSPSPPMRRGARREPRSPVYRADDLLYVVGATTAWRYRWDGRGWRSTRLASPLLDDADHSYGWDPVVSGGQLWFIDNGAHDYGTTMQRAGVGRPLRLIRVSPRLRRHEAVEVCGLAEGRRPIRRCTTRLGGSPWATTRLTGSCRPSIQRPARAHLAARARSRRAHGLVPDTGELVLHDFHGPRVLRTGLAARSADGGHTRPTRPLCVGCWPSVGR